MTRTIRMKDIAGLKANATTAPFVTTEPAKIGGVRGGGSTPAPQGVIFETDFSQDTNYSISGTPFPNRENVPTGFTFAHATGQSVAEVLPVGPGGKNAMRLSYDPALGQPTISFMRHLTGDISVGYPELYFRYRMKFPDAFKFGDGTGNLPYWKWFRLAQNHNPDGSNDTENRPDSYYVVGNLSGSDVYGSRFNVIFAGNEEDGTDEERSFGSSGGPRAGIDWYITGNPTPHSDNTGYFDHVPGWAIDWTTNRGRFQTFTDSLSQDWHTIEIRVKAATAPGADDGVIELFFDGVNQGMWRRIEDYGAPDTGPFTGPPTAVNGSGFNSIAFFDNMNEFNADFDLVDVDGWVDIADLVVSTSRIGHDYNVG